jgi:hypothetical protein
VLVGYNDFATTHPEIAKQWNFEKNGELKPTDVFSTSVRKVWWKCEHGHEWTATINSRTHGVGCPICSRRKVLVGYNDLLTTHPEIAKEWNYEKNGELKPTDVMYGSYRKVWWINEEKGEWLASIYGRVRSQARHQSKQC